MSGNSPAEGEGELAADGTPGEAGGPRRATFRIREMDCPDCARRIQEHLKGVRGIRDAAGNPVSRRLHVEFDPRRLTSERIRSEVGRLGYLASPDEPGSSAGPSVPTWTSPTAIRAYVSAGILALGFLLRWAGVRPLLLSLPLHALHLPDLLFVVAAGVGGWNFFPAAVHGARTLRLDMNVLMSVAILGALAIGEYPEAAAIGFLFSVAELLETYSVDRVQRSVESLMELSPDRATVVRDGHEVIVAASEVRRDERVLVRPGEKVPVDGTVLDGGSSVDQSPITGESVPVRKDTGDEVYAGSLNGEGFLRLRADRLAGESTLARIIELIEEAESQKAPSERFVERFTRYYTPGVALLAVLVVALPTLAFGAPFHVWFLRGLTLLVIACPCALVISTPVAVVSGITAAARNGVLIKGGRHLEAIGRTKVFAFDKTGTATAGHPEVVEVVSLNGAPEEDVLAVAAAVESRSEHPLARAIVRAAGRRGIAADRWDLEGFQGLRGRGVRALLDGREHRVGTPELFEGSGALAQRLADFQRRGRTAVVVGPAGAPMGLVALMDRPRSEAAEALRRLKASGVRRTVMLTGDHPETAEAIAREVGFDEVHAGLLPEEKVERIRMLQERYGDVAMVGDGVNDGPALAAATVGIAMGVAGSDTALETADVALMGDELTRLAYLRTLSQRGRAVIRQNIGASLALKLALAVGVPLGLVSLIVAVVVGDMGAAFGVTTNALRLARLRPDAD